MASPAAVIQVPGTRVMYDIEEGASSEDGLPLLCLRTPYFAHPVNADSLVSPVSTPPDNVSVPTYP
jgi:hypothetical protein